MFYVAFQELHKSTCIAISLTVSSDFCLKRKEDMLLVARINQEILFEGYEKLTRLEIG
jgi:hypothetical protein